MRQTLEPVVDVKLLVNMNSTSYGNPLVVSEEIITTAESDITGVSQCPPDYEYALSSSSHDNRTPLETVEIGIQTDVGMAEMTELINIKEKSQNPDAVLRELFTNKVTANDESVKKYTGLPSKSMLDGLYDVLAKASPCLVVKAGLRNPTISRTKRRRRQDLLESFLNMKNLL